MGVHEAKTTLSELLRRVAAGEEVIISRNGEPVAKIVRLAAAKPRVLGQDAGLFRVPDDFDDPLPDEVISAFYQ